MRAPESVTRRASKVLVVPAFDQGTSCSVDDPASDATSAWLLRGLEVRQSGG